MTPMTDQQLLETLHRLHPDPQKLWLNVSKSEWCEGCGNEGYVCLAARVTVGGISYSQTAPCKWCEEGRRRYDRCRTATPHHPAFEPLSNFGWSDIIPAGSQYGGRLDPAKRKRLAAAMSAALRGMAGRALELGVPGEQLDLEAQ